MDIIEDSVVELRHLGLDDLKHSDDMLQNDWNKEYSYAGSFQTTLMRTIEIADVINLQKISIVYPNLVQAWKEWRKCHCVD